MTLYQRKFSCAICGDTMVYDDARCILRCKCGEHPTQVPDKVLMENFRIIA